MKTKILSLLAMITLSFAGSAQIDRSKMPQPGPDPVVKLGKANTFNLKNGLKVIMVENHKLPRVSVNLTIDNAPYFEGNIAGVSSMMGSLLGRGTNNITKDEFNEQVDFLGANLNFYSTGASARSLKKYFREILSLLADGVKNAQFIQEEFDKEVKITLDNLKASEKSVTAIARRVEDALTYGKNHPYGEFITPETVKNIRLEDVRKNYNSYFAPNNAYLVIVGDIDLKETKKLVTYLFNDWQKGTIPSTTIPEATNVSTTEINFVNMPNAVQSEIAVINNIDLKLGDKDYYAALLANNILGGGGSARLFNNLREDKGYTYGSYSSIRQSKHAATFRATASVRNMVTDSSVVEIQKEINKIRYQKVTEKELNNAKEEYIGGFVMDVQKPETAASFALNIARYNLSEKFYANYIKNINAVTLDDVQNAAINYFKGDKARIVITGKGIDVLNNLEKTDYTITYFDKEGNPTVKPAMTLPIPEGVTASSVVDRYIEAIGGMDSLMAVKTTMKVANATIQGTPMVMTTKSSSPNKTSVVITVMGQTIQKIIFDGEKGYQEGQGKKIAMEADDLIKAKARNTILSDLEYKKGELLRIEPLEEGNAYVLKFEETEIFYDLETGLKIKEVVTSKTPDGKEVKIPTLYSDYKEVSGVKFPHNIAQKMGSMDFNFIIEEIKINEDVSDEDFQ
jgi:predicted Zn-dependent peptidase